MSSYEDYATDQAMDAAVQMQAEFERLPRVICSWCRGVLQDGGAGTTHSVCAACDAKIKAVKYCPECGAKQDHNGMLAWCNNGHVYKILKTDGRYDDGTNSNAVLLAWAEAKDAAHTCKWQGTRYGCPHNADAAYVATVMEIADGEGY